MVIKRQIQLIREIRKSSDFDNQEANAAYQGNPEINAIKLLNELNVKLNDLRSLTIIDAKI